MKKFALLLLVTLVALSSVFAQAEAESSKVAGKLVIYSSGKEEEAQAVADAFNKHYPKIEITIIQVDSGSLQTRVNTEWPNPDGDVIFLLGSENLEVLVEKLHPYVSKNDAKIAPEYKDTTAKEPRFYATSMPLQAIMYNTDLLKGNMAPKSWKDLADPKYYGMIELANPATSGSAFAQLYQMNQLYGWDFVKSVVANGTVYVSSSTKGPNDVARGEFAITVTGEANVASAISNGDPVAYVHPAEGTGLRTEGCAILENCKNLEAAQLFIDFMTSTEGFNIIASMGRRPVSTEANVPANLPALKDMKFYEYNNANVKSVKKKMQAAFGALL